MAQYIILLLVTNIFHAGVPLCTLVAVPLIQLPVKGCGRLGNAGCLTWVLASLVGDPKGVSDLD